MGVLLALFVGLTIWIVGWALGAKAFDTFLVTLLLVLVAVTLRAVMPFVQRLLGNESQQP